MRCRLQSLATGNVQDFTYKTNEMVEVADIDKLEMQYLYQMVKTLFSWTPQFEQVTFPVN